jgi:tryptophanyl-tRNA synthetase
MKRGLFFAHRELEQILAAKEQGKPIYVYTGRGPSSAALHIGHVIPFILTKYLQEALDCFLTIQVTDDEKFMRDNETTWEEISGYADSNIRDILACGFNPEKTFIVRQSRHVDLNVPFLTEMSRVMPLHVVQKLFGFTDEHSVGYVVFPAKQIGPAFAEYFAKLFSASYVKEAVCLIPAGREQDPYFRFARDMAERLKLKRVSTIYGRFIPALQGDKKMTASSQESAIYLTDTAAEIRTKIIEFAADAWTASGADLTKDVVYKYVEAFEPDDAKLAEIQRRYGPGELLEGEERMGVAELKEHLIELLVKLIGTHQENRKAISAEVMDGFESIKKWG